MTSTTDKFNTGDLTPTLSLKGEGVGTPSHTPLPMGRGQGEGTLLLQKRAKALRKQATPEEQRLWNALRNRQLNGLKFYRQRVMDYYIVDFYCPELQLVIEVDGGGHYTDEQQKYDAKRTQFLEFKGLKVMRVLNSDVIHNLAGVCEAILHTGDLTPTLSLKGEGVRASSFNPLPVGRGQGEGLSHAN
jgi:very-short-patch-repair endonuclease